MEYLTIDNKYKEKIQQHIEKNIGYYLNDYKSEIEDLNNSGILTKQFADAILDNLVYECKTTKLKLKPSQEFKEEEIINDKIFDSIPKSKDYDETSYAKDINIEIYKNMNAQTVYSNIQKCLDVNQSYEKIFRVQNLKERANASINSIKSIDGQKVELTLEDKKELQKVCNNLKLLLSDKKTNEEAIESNIELYNKQATKLWKNYLTDKSETGYLVHNLSKGSFDGDFDSKYMSTSLVTDKQMGLFSEQRNNNFGFIINPKNIISASSNDTYTNNSPVNKQVGVFESTPPIMLPWEVERKCIEQTIENNGEMLNYDNRNVYSEIVVEDYEIEAMYYRSNGEGELSPNYETARKMAEARGIPLKELDISKAREKLGLEPMTPEMKKKFFTNILRRNFCSEKEIQGMFDYYSNLTSINTNEYKTENDIIEKYNEEFYQKYLQLRNGGAYTKDDIMQELLTTVSNEEIEELEYFYSNRKQEKIKNENYSQVKIINGPVQKEVSNKQEETTLWKNRFKSWYGAIYRVPEDEKNKFIRMKSDIVKTITSRFKERSSLRQENTQIHDSNER